MSDDILSATGADALRETIDGAERVFTELCAYDRADLLRGHRAKKREELLQDLRDSGLDDKATIFQTLQGFSKEKIVEKHWHDFINSPDGKLSALAMSLEKTNAGKGEQLCRQLKWSDDQILLAVAKVCNLTIGSGEGHGQRQPKTDSTATFGDAAAQAEGGNEENPTMPQMFSQTPTNSTGA